jgi:predicted ATPase
MALRGYGSLEAEQQYERAKELCQYVGETPHLFPVLWGLWLVHSSRGEFETAHGLGQELLALAERVNDSTFLLQAHHALWNTLVYGGGEFASGLEHAQRGIALYDPALHRSHAFTYGGHDPGECCRRHAAVALWSLGYADQALEMARDGLRLAREFGHFSSIAWGMMSCVSIHQLRREAQDVEEQVGAVIRLASEYGFVHLIEAGMFIRTWAGTVRRQGTDHVAQMREALNTRSSGLDTWRALFLSLLAERLGLAQQAEAGLAVADEALGAVRKGHRWYEADVQRIRGELLLKRDSTDTARAEECFRTALDIAGRQSAKSLELPRR